MSIPNFNGIQNANFNGIQNACVNNDIECVKQSLKSGYVIEYLDICTAIEYSRFEIVKLLLANLPNIDEYYIQTIIHTACKIAACRIGNLEIVKLLFANSQINSDKYYSIGIKYAFMFSHLEVVEFLFNLLKQDHTKWGYEFVKLCIMGENVYCQVENDKVVKSLSNFNNILQEEYVKWQYRLGGEKYALARNSIDNV